MEVILLPFLKPKQASVAGIIMKTREPDHKQEESQEQDEQAIAIEACAEELIKAVHSRDVKAAAQAMRDAFEILDSMPHTEGEHENESEEME